jgi:uncharacterized protein YraI
MPRLHLSPLLIMLAFSIPILSNAKNEIRVTGNNVNLRAGPSDQTEVLTQASSGDTLVASSLDGDWLEVEPPKGSFVWIHKDLVENTIVKAPKARLRAGPGTAFSSVGNISEGSSLNVISEFNGWLKVVPPANCKFWISRQHIEPITQKPVIPESKPPAQTVQPKPAIIPPKSTPETIAIPPHPVGSASPITIPARIPAVASTSLQEGDADLPEGLTRDMLISTMDQGKQVTYKGTLKSSILTLRKTTRLTLVERDEHGDIATLCYVFGNMDQLNAVVGKKIILIGREYRLQGLRFSVIAPEQIIIRQ